MSHNTFDDACVQAAFELEVQLRFKNSKCSRALTYMATCATFFTCHLVLSTAN